ncbi:hypothetical protein JOD24_002490 [Kroppenstedtia sanguinis]|uniref:Uncharacterized protein n=1 Tax=Kroppenstedtia sanguinis TaxID=1380684 RepID=A0ABW4CE91_9BACL
MMLKYYEWWDLMFHKPEFPMSETEAKKWHEEEKPYVVVVLEEGKMKYVVNVNFNLNYCHVDHLNSQQKRIQMDAYTEYGEGLFLSDIKVWKDPASIEHTTTLYKPDGTYLKSHVDAQGHVTEDETTGTCDVSTHFRKMIRFGDYDPVLPKRTSE